MDEDISCGKGLRMGWCRVEGEVNRGEMRTSIILSTIYVLKNKIKNRKKYTVNSNSNIKIA